MFSSQNFKIFLKVDLKVIDPTTFTLNMLYQQICMLYIKLDKPGTVYSERETSLTNYVSHD